MKSSTVMQALKWVLKSLFLAFVLWYFTLVSRLCLEEIGYRYSMVQVWSAGFLVWMTGFVFRGLKN